MYYLQKDIENFKYNISCGCTPEGSKTIVLYHTKLRGIQLYNLKKYLNNNIEKYLLNTEYHFWQLKKKHQIRKTFLI